MPTKFHKTIILTAALAAIALAGCESHSNGKKLDLGTSGGSATTSTVSQTAEKVDVVQVETVEESRYLRLTGSLEADEQSDVASRVAGIVQEVMVERGSVVRKGDVLLKLDPTDAENALAEGVAAIEELAVRLGLENPNQAFNPANQPEVKSANATLELAAANFKRDTELHGRKVIPKADYDRTRSEYDAAKQRYNQAWHQAAQLYQSLKTAQTRLRTLRKAVTDTTITAPFDGLVVERDVSVGERVVTQPMGQGGGKVATIVKVDPMRLALTIPEQYVSYVKPGMTVQFYVEAFQGRSFTGNIAHIAPSVDPSSRSLTVEALVKNPDLQLRPGLFATARLVLPEQHQAMYVPSSAIKRQNDVSKLYVVSDGVAREKVVETAETSGTLVRVLSGLSQTEQVVAEAGKVSDGTVVR